MARITQGKRGGVVVQMNRDDTRKWETSTERGEIYRRALRTQARDFAAKHSAKGNIEIYAAACEGGWTADVERIEQAA